MQPNEDILEQATLELAAAAILPYMWFIKLLRAHNEFVEDLMDDMGIE